MIGSVTISIHTREESSAIERLTDEQVAEYVLGDHFDGLLTGARTAIEVDRISGDVTTHFTLSGTVTEEEVAPGREEAQGYRAVPVADADEAADMAAEQAAGLTTDEFGVDRPAPTEEFS